MYHERIFMLKQQIPLTTPLQESYADELSKRIFFLSDAILDFALLRENDFIHAVDITTQSAVSSEELTRKLNFLVKNDILPQYIVPSKVIWHSQASRSLQEDMYRQMIDAGLVFEAGEGQIGVGELFLSVMNYFDDMLRTIAVKEFGAREYQYPTLIPTTVMTQCDYFKSFPHYLMFVTRLHSDIDTYAAFLEQARGSDDVRTFALNYCNNADYCLPPTMCFHTYHQYEGRELPDEMGTVITSKGKSFRFESRYRKTLERLWDFTIREMVFLGPRDFVLDCRSRFMEHVLTLAEKLELVGYCEVANDPFFCNMDAAEKVWSQRLLELKYELRLNVTRDRTIAVGSFNFHERFFGENFSIGAGKIGNAYTSCIGFGLERLAYAFFCQYGIEKSKWPPEVLNGELKRSLV
jgi:hypothetical protein